MAEVMDAEELRSLRKRAGMSQAELAEHIGMARETISQMERGSAPIEKRTALAIRWITSKEGRPKRSLSTILNDTAEIIDAILVRGSATDDQARLLRRLHAEWGEGKGLGVADALFTFTRGSVGMLRASAEDDPMHAHSLASLTTQKQQWRALWRTTAGARDPE